MKIKCKKLFLAICIACAVVCFSLGTAFAITTTRQEVFAENAIETSKGASFSSGESLDFTQISEYSTKFLVFDIKTNGKVVQLQLTGDSTETGIIRTTPDRTPETADRMSVENGTGVGGYWLELNTVAALGDGWYRWVVDLSKLKNSSSENSTINKIKCFEGTDVQIKNLFSCENYVYVGSSGTSASPVTIENWGDKTIQFEANLSDGKTRRFIFRDSSNSNLHGFIAFNTSKLQVENPNFISGVNDYMIDATTTPKNLGNGWYRFILDMSEVKKQSGKDGSETASKIRNYTETADTVLEIKNLKIYNPADEADYTIDAKSTITLETDDQIAKWGTQTIQFDAYLPDSVSRRIYFRSATGDVSGLIDLTNKKYEYLTGNPYKKDISNVTPLENDWYRFVVDLNELKRTNSDVTGNETITRIKNLPDGTGATVYLKNIVNVTPYNPADEADYTIDAKSTITLETDDQIAKWGTQIIQFDAYLPDSVSRRIYFGSATGNVSGLIDLTNKKYEYLTGNPYTKVISNVTPLENDWYRFVVDLNELKRTNSDVTGNETITIINNFPDGTGATVYLKNIVNVTPVYDPSSEEGAVVLKSNEWLTFGVVKNWGEAKISLDVYHPSLDTQERNFIFGHNGTNVSGYFGFVNGKLSLRTSAKSGYWVESSTQPEELENGWYKWTLDLNELGTADDNKNSFDRLKTVSQIFNRGETDVYVKNVKIIKNYDPDTDDDMIWVKGNNKIVDHSGEDVIIYDWAVRETTIEFDIYHTPDSTNTFAFASERIGDIWDKDNKGTKEPTTIEKDNRISNKCYFGNDGKICIYYDEEKKNGVVIKEEEYTDIKVGSYELDEETGWCHVTITATSLIDLSIDSGKAVNRALRCIRVGKNSTYYVKNFTYSQGEKTYDNMISFVSSFEASENGFVDVGKIDLWRNHTLKFKTFAGSLCDNIGLSHSGVLNTFGGKGNIGYSLTYPFTELDDSCTFERIEGTNWYQWTIDLSKLEVIPESTSGIDAVNTPLTHLWFNANTFNGACFIKDIQFTSDAIKMENGASIRISEPSGIRFTSEINLKSSLLEGATNIQKGTLIIPTNLLNGTLLTLDTTNKLDIPAVKFLNEEGTIFTGVLVNIPPEQYERSITARGYISFTKGGKDYVLYSESQSRSISQVAESALEDHQDTKDDKYKYFVTVGDKSFYSQLSQNSIDIVKSLIK